MIDDSTKLGSANSYKWQQTKNAFSKLEEMEDKDSAPSSKPDSMYSRNSMERDRYGKNGLDFRFHLLKGSRIF